MASKVILFCYMRGGSTVASQMINVDPKAMVLYEPMAAFYMANYGMRAASKPHNIKFTDNWRPMYVLKMLFYQISFVPTYVQS